MADDEAFRALLEHYYGDRDPHAAYRDPAIQQSPVWPSLPPLPDNRPSLRPYDPQAARPMDWAERSGVGENAGLAPLRGGAALGELIGQGRQAIGDKDWKTAADLAPSALSIFAGVKAKTANMPMLERAQAMAAKGVPREAIWGETGWFQGRDGRWRFEIDDSTSRFNETGRVKGDYLTHPGGMFKAYRDVEGMPDLGDVSLIRAGPPNTGAYWGLPADVLQVGHGTPDPRSIALHEYQHAIQGREGFARGWNPSDAAMPAVETINKRLSELAREMEKYQKPGAYREYTDPRGSQAAAEYDRLMGERSNVSGFDLYRRAAGETEARNVQKRMDMTPEQRRATPPWETQDVPDAQQILREAYDGPQMSTEDILKLYRGESAHNKKGGPYYTPDREWARQFTQSGQDHEIKSASVKSADVYDPPKPVYAGDPDAIAKVVAEARSKGYKAVRLDEGADQPQSVYVFNKTGLRR